MNEELDNRNENKELDNRNVISLGNIVIKNSVNWT